MPLVQLVVILIVVSLVSAKWSCSAVKTAVAIFHDVHSWTASYFNATDSLKSHHSINNAILKWIRTLKGDRYVEQR